MLILPRVGNPRASLVLFGQPTGNAGSSATKGTAVELTSGIGFNVHLLHIFVTGYGTTGTTSQCCLDILVGDATEEVLIPNLLAGFCGGSGVVGGGGKQWIFPLYIPSGTRIACRQAGDRLGASINVYVSAYGWPGSPPFEVGSRVDTYGITTVPAGTDVTAGYSGAEGNWQQIVASTTHDHIAIFPSFHPTDGDTTFSNVQTVRVEMGHGAAGSEAALGDYEFRIDSAEQCEGPRWPIFPLFRDIPAGSRLAMRCSYAAASDTGQPDCAIHAVS